MATTVNVFEQRDHAFAGVWIVDPSAMQTRDVAEVPPSVMVRRVFLVALLRSEVVGIVQAFCLTDQGGGR